MPINWKRSQNLSKFQQQELSRQELTYMRHQAYLVARVKAVRGPSSSHVLSMRTRASVHRPPVRTPSYRS